MLDLFGLHELVSWRGAFLCVRVEKVCKVFTVCVDVCPVGHALCSTARKSRELLFITKKCLLPFSELFFFPSRFLFFTFCHVDSCCTMYVV